MLFLDYILRNVALPFEWMVVKPHITSGKDIPEVGEDESSVDTTALSRTLDVESPFSIEPQNGVLEPSGIASFMLTFAPPEASIRLRILDVHFAWSYLFYFCD